MAATASPPPHLIVVGLDEWGKALVAHAARMWHAANKAAGAI